MAASVNSTQSTRFVQLLLLVYCGVFLLFPGWQICRMYSTLKKSFKLNFLVHQKSNFTAVFGAYERNGYACVFFCNFCLILQ